MLILFIILIVVVVVVVVVYDDTYYWVYWSSDHQFQVYYRVRQLLLQGATAHFITKCDRYYKVRQNSLSRKISKNIVLHIGKKGLDRGGAIFILWHACASLIRG